MNIYYVDCIEGELFKDPNGTPLVHSFSKLPFRIQKITLCPSSRYAQQLIQEAKFRQKQINFNSANSSGVIRPQEEVRYKSLCGLLIEQLCYQMLKHYNSNKNVSIELDRSFNSIDQIDLRICKTWLNHNSECQNVTKTVEIRSSFPFKPIEKVVSHDFDILGGYTNNVKIGEVEKDFYLRFLFSLDYPEHLYVKNGNKIDYNKTTLNVLRNLYFDEELNLQRDMNIYFIGGATKSMMADESISYNGSMTSSNFNKSHNAQYRKLKARNALDCVSIIQMMLNVITSEAVNGK